jgi:hypothetical protein
MTQLCRKFLIPALATTFALGLFAFQALLHLPVED